MINENINTSSSFLSTKLLFLLWLLSIGHAYGQFPISKQAMITDLEFLNQAVVDGHPINYNKAVKQVELTHIIKEVETNATDSISLEEYEYLLRKAIYHIGCTHTSIISGLNKSKASEQNFFPEEVKIHQGNLYINHEGKIQKIERINGLPVEIILDKITYYFASDGIDNSLSYTLFNTNPSYWLAAHLGFVESYSIEGDNFEIQLIASDSIARQKVKDEHFQLKMRNENNRFGLYRDIPYLKINRFRKADKSFFKKVFQRIEAMETDELIIDLRGNTGGSRKAGIVLARHLAESKFRFAICQPKLNTYQYLNSKGKFFWFLSKLKYNLGDFYRSKKSDLGRTFHYAHRPKSKRYEGKIYVLTDGLSISASTMVTTWLKLHSNAVFIGTPTGGGYNGHNAGAYPQIELPKSGVLIKFPAYRVILDKNSNIYTGLEADNNPIQDVKDLFSSSDLILEKAVELAKEEGL